jgi:hypothetical protein
MVVIPATDPIALELVRAIREGDVAALDSLLRAHPALARAQIADPESENTRSLLHVATDWPGHFANGPAVVAALVAAGAEVNARGGGRITETPLHWAASSDDVAALDALLDAGANIEADGAVIAGGTALEDAVAFAQWNAARRLVEGGALVTFRGAAALGLMDIVSDHVEGADSQEVAMAFWYACHGGQRETADCLLARGADCDWVAPWDGLTPLEAAERNGFDALAQWLRERGARTRAEIG